MRRTAERSPAPPPPDASPGRALTRTSIMSAPKRARASGHDRPPRGGTAASSKTGTCLTCFNAHSRTGSDADVIDAIREDMAFQPALPYGERLPALLAHGGEVLVSTRAPRTGSDAAPVATSIRPRTFQPAPPVRGATRGPTGRRGADGVSTRAPVRGATLRVGDYRVIFIVSTRAPRTGSDIDAHRIVGRMQVSTRAPRTGSDAAIAAGRAERIRFQPAPPVRGATAPRRGESRRSRVSTRAPRTGSDPIVLI